MTGAHFGRRGPIEQTPAARDRELARRLWEESARLAGIG
jgi:hypothetical protein